MKIVSSDLMQKIDSAAIASGIPSLILMEKAGKALADVVARQFEKSDGKIVVLVGRGNNGGDGLVSARYLINAGYDVDVEMTSQPEDLSPDAKANWEQLAAITTNIYNLKDNISPGTCGIRCAGAVCYIDALFGTGLSKPLTGIYEKIVNDINSQKGIIISADIPSGLSANKGIALGTAVRAKITVTFAFPKLGFFIGKGVEYAGKVEVVDIGIPKNISDRFVSPYELIDKTLVDKYLPERKQLDHKGTYGHVLVIAGNNAKLGAGYLASMSALRSGCGLVTYALPERAFEKFDTKYPEIMPVQVSDDKRGYFLEKSVSEIEKLVEDKDAVVLGPAVGLEKSTVAFVCKLISQINKPIILDADGLNVIAGKKDVFKYRKHPTVLTPHPKEMARLLGTDTKTVQENRLQSAKKLADETNGIVVLKGHNTLITDGKRMFVNPTGNSGMATAGSGDVLTGIIASFIAQGVEPLYSAVIGVYLHGLAGDVAVKETTERGMVASDIIKHLFKNISL